MDTAQIASIRAGIVRRVRAYADEHKLRPSALAKRAGLGINTLRNFRDENWSPSEHTLAKLERLVSAGESEAA